MWFLLIASNPWKQTDILIHISHPFTWVYGNQEESQLLWSFSQRKWRFDYVEILAIGHGVQFSNFNKHLITKQITLPILYLSGCFSSLNEDQLAKLDISILEDEIQLIIMRLALRSPWSKFNWCFQVVTSVFFFLLILNELNGPIQIIPICLIG